jgi:hypothetical protein
MPKIKKILSSIKKDFTEHPADYAVAFAAGTTAGVIAYILMTKNVSVDKSLHLDISEGVANFMKDTGTKAFFETPIGQFELSYVIPE